MSETFTFDGHDYEITFYGLVLDSSGELVCDVSQDIAKEYWIVQGAEDCTVHHVNGCSKLEAVKSFISATY